jgi:hypothetical protein
MPLRHQIYRYFRKSPGSLMRFILANVVVMVGLGVMVGLIDMRLGDYSVRWGLVVWESFLVGFSGIVAMNTLIEMCGNGYPEDKR